MPTTTPPPPGAPSRNTTLTVREEFTDAGRAALARPAAVFLARMADGSRPAMRDSLARIVETVAPGHDASTFPWASLRYEHVVAVRAALAQRYAPATANRHLAALRGVLKEAKRLGLMTSEEYGNAVDVDRVRGDSPQAGRMLTPDEVSALLDACPNDFGGLRDRAMVIAAAHGGLRRAEIARLGVHDVADGKLKVLGKGRKYREVPLSAGALAVIEAWRAVRGPTPGALFPPLDRAGRPNFARHLSVSGVWTVLRSVMALAEVKATPHDFRRTYISTLLDQKVDASTVQKMAGHARVDTTMRYDRRGEETRRAAAEMLAAVLPTKGKTP